MRGQEEREATDETQIDTDRRLILSICVSSVKICGSLLDEWEE
jgi:hypothetical protein